MSDSKPRNLSMGVRACVWPGLVFAIGQLEGCYRNCLTRKAWML